MDPRLIVPYLIAALIAWRLYRRARRSFGRQRVRAGALWVSIGLLTALTVLFITTAVIGPAHDPRVLEGLIAGIGCGAALGYVGLRHTKFEVTSEGRFYTPHTYIGLLVTALFVGRLLYRYLSVYNGALPTAPAGDGAAMFHGPFTLAAFGVVVGYYVLFYLGILQRTRVSPVPLAPTPQG
jgi:hypothetical protein